MDSGSQEETQMQNKRDVRKHNNSADVPPAATWSRCCFTFPIKFYLRQKAEL